MTPVLRSSTPRRLRPAALLLALAATLVAGSAVVPAAAHADPTTSAAAVPAGRFVATAPTRVLDTRYQGGSFGSGQTRVVDTDRAIPGTATAVVFNLTVVTPSGSGFLAAFPAGTPRPAASSLNFVAGQNRANMVTVAVGTGSFQNDVAVYVNAGAGRAHVVVDVLGYYGAGGVGAPAGTSYQPLLTPVRMFDTRNSVGPLTNTWPKNTGIVSIDYGSPAVNKTISAVVMTITVTQPTGAGFLTLWNGAGPQPSGSTISWVKGQSIGNLAIIPVRCSNAACTTVEFYARNNGAPTTQLVGDISGMYATPSTAGLLFNPNAPVRVTDTRTNMAFGTLGSGGVGVTNVSSRVRPSTRAIAVNIQAVNPHITTWLTSWPTGQSKPAVTNLNAAAGSVAAIAAQVKLGGGQFNTTTAWGPVDVVVDLAGTFDLDSGVGSSSAAANSAPAGAAAAPTVTGSLAVS